MKEPVISYYGGKQRMASNIVPLIPRHTGYVEPFCGGAAILFAKPWPNGGSQSNYREVINDIDGRLINFYRQLRDNGPALIEKIQLTLYSREEYQLAKDLDCDDKLEVARRYYVNVQQSFANIMHGGWGTGVFSTNHAAIWTNKLSRLPQYLDRMAAVHIENDDALAVIKRWDSPQTCFYCDPPYPNTDQGDYKGYTAADYTALVETLDNCSGSFLLSNYDQDITIPDDWERFEFEAHCAASGKGMVGAGRDKGKAATKLGDRKRTEVVFRRFNKDQVRPEIEALYASGNYDCFALPIGKQKQQMLF